MMKWIASVGLWLLASVASAQILTPSPQGISAVSSGITVCTSGNCAKWQVPVSAPTLTSQITGTMTSLTLTAEATADGQTWAAVLVQNLATGAWSSTATATGQFAIANTGIVGFRWRCTTFASGGANVTLTRGTASSRPVGLTGANGQSLALLSLTELTTIAAAASTDTAIQMPAGAIVLAVSVRVTTVIPTATTFSVGDSGSATRFSTANVSVAANSTDAGTKAGAYYNASALAIRLTMNGSQPNATTGRVRVTIYYLLSTPPTS